MFKKVKTNMTSINYHQISNMMSEQLNVTFGKMQKKDVAQILRSVFYCSKIGQYSQYLRNNRGQPIMYTNIIPIRDGTS